MKQRSLLEFAITASAAVLPVMLVVLLLVAVVRPADEARGLHWNGTAAQGDRYVSVRQLQALKTFEQAIVPRRGLPAGTLTSGASATAIDEALPACRQAWASADVAGRLAAIDTALQRFSTRANPRTAEPLALDATRWLAAARASLERPIEVPQYPDRSFRLGCADLAAAVHALARGDGQLLEALSWRGTVSAPALARWAPQQQVEITARHLMRRNPWSGLAGCLYLGNDAAGAPSHVIAGAGSAQARLCALPAMAGASAPPLAVAGEPTATAAPDDPRWAVPPSLPAMLAPLEALRQPSQALYRLYTEKDAATVDIDPPGATATATGTDARTAAGTEPAKRASAGAIRAVSTDAAGRGGTDAPPGTGADATPPPADAAHHGPNRIALDGTPLDVGFSLRLTIDPATQALAQRTAACYTGRHDVCRALGIQRAEDTGHPLGQRLLEGAMVRMAAIAIVDVQSGRIDALAGALTPCARQEVDGPGRDAACDKRLPYPVRYRPDALLNPAVYHDAMPASTIKPIMAAAFLNDGSEQGRRWLAAERAALAQPGTPARQSLRGELLRSDSARFLDRMLCIDGGPQPCRRPWDVQAAALALGWDAACAPGTGQCGRHDLLFGRAIDARAADGLVQPLATPVAYGRLLTEPGGARHAAGRPMALMPPVAMDPAVIRRCSAGADGARGTEDDWEKCRGRGVVDIAAEGWGQGHARATTLGVAGMLSALAAAANGQETQRRPHLVDALQDSAGRRLAPAAERWGLATPQPVGVSHEAAEVILSGLSFSHREGTARSACEQVFDARRCRDIGWLAGKTGTPSFPNDGVSLNELAQLCRPGALPAATGPAADARAAACSSLRPYKWYVGAYRANGASTGPWSKVIAVLAERNWVRQTGIVHGAGDRGPNPAAEIAMQIAGRRVGALPATPASPAASAP